MSNNNNHGSNRLKPARLAFRVGRLLTVVRLRLLNSEFGFRAEGEDFRALRLRFLLCDGLP